MSTTILRNSSIPASFKCGVEAAAPSFVNKITGETVKVEIAINPNPITHFNSSSDVFPNVIKTIANVLSSAFFKCKAKSALVFQKESGEIIAAAISDYDSEGENYFFNITFDANEVKGISKDKIVNYTDFIDEARNMSFWEIFNVELMTAHNYSISDKDMVNILTMQCFETLYRWFDTNAKEGETVELIIDDYIGKFETLSEKEYNDALKTVAIGSVEIVKDVKKMAIQFGEEMKALAKGCNDINS